MTTLTISAEADSGFIKVFVNDEEESPQKILDGPGSTTITLEEGEVYHLTYFVKGKSGEKYAVKITDPPNAVWTDRDTVDNDGKVAGQHRIRLDKI